MATTATAAAGGGGKREEVWSKLPSVTRVERKKNWKCSPSLSLSLSLSLHGCNGWERGEGTMLRRRRRRRRKKRGRSHRLRGFSFCTVSLSLFVKMGWLCYLHELPSLLGLCENVGGGGGGGRGEVTSWAVSLSTC